ncbi:fibronectin type III domain-containing protein [Micromonospora musae]|uniref:fibronectin type III domain-containing protein n=1 Tax=Micromonospora musae TaxID=1894970 RepID=UPI0018F6F9C8|nr:fibronectin type III domain-containing protein [Micromonospora musae]
MSIPPAPAWGPNALPWGVTAELQVLPAGAPASTPTSESTPRTEPAPHPSTEPVNFAAAQAPTGALPLATPQTTGADAPTAGWNTQAADPGGPQRPPSGSTGPAPGEPGRRGRSRAATTVAVTAAVVVAAAAAATGVGALVVGGENGAAATTPSASAVNGPPPGDVRLHDDLSTITLNWTDPSGGKVPFMVVGGRAGQPMRAMATVDPGQNSYTVNGLNPGFDYCFTVLAAWSSGTFATSAQVCTARGGGTPTT